MSVDEVRLILVTAPEGAASDLARRLVEARLAACVNILPGVTSVFRWEGRVQEEGEALLVLKTSTSAVEALREAVQELHPYDVPEFLVVPVESGLDRYLAWVAAETGGRPS